MVTAGCPAREADGSRSRGELLLLAYTYVGMYVVVYLLSEPPSPPPPPLSHQEKKKRKKERKKTSDFGVLRKHRTQSARVQYVLRMYITDQLRSRPSSPSPFSERSDRGDCWRSERPGLSRGDRWEGKASLRTPEEIPFLRLGNWGGGGLISETGDRERPRVHIYVVPKKRGGGGGSVFAVAGSRAAGRERECVCVLS